MIWNWMVTSSAVVGSSAIRRLGRRGQGQRDHHPLRHAAGELVRVAAQDRAPGRAVRRRQQLASRAAAPRRRAARVDAQHLRERLADAEDRVQRGARVLEDHRDLLAADRAHLALGRSVSRSCAPEEDLARRRPAPAARRSRAIESAVTVLPEPLSPTMPRISPCSTARVDAVEHAQRPGGREEGDARIVDAKQGRRRGVPRTAGWGSSAHAAFTRALIARRVERSCRPSPIRLNPSTAIAIASPGKNETHHWPVTIRGEAQRRSSRPTPASAAGRRGR